MSYDIVEQCSVSNPANFIWDDCADYISSWNWVAYSIFISYVPTIFLLRAVMRGRDAFDLSGPLKLWNCLMSGLSFAGFIVAIPYLFRVGFERSYTSLDYNHGIMGMVGILFNLSKIPEMIDTLFIVLRKRELVVLHWFHHLTVAIFCWMTIFTTPSTGWWFATMNLFVHSTMYGYFAFANEIRRHITWFNPMLLTVLQIVQMVWGLTVCTLHIFHRDTVYDSATIANASYAIPMYASYLYLFCKFFEKKYKFVTPVNWTACAYLFFTHVLGVFGAVRLYSYGSWKMVVEVALLWQVCGMGITMGAHRLWSHRSYKATAPVRLVLMLLASMANQGSVYHWCRDHRVHHKHSDTPGDPHNISRGFFYSHVGWLMLKKDEVVKVEGRKLECNDLLEDPFVRLNHRLDPFWNQFWCFIVPGIYGLWRIDSFYDGMVIYGGFRWVVGIHATWCVNSVSHTFGYKPYDPTIPPTNNLFTSIVAVGEGWHNFHHAHPYDYAAAEHNWFIEWNPSKFVIDLLSLLGQTSDHKRAKIAKSS